MKKATLICLSEDKDAALRALQRCEEFMPIAEGGGLPQGSDTPAAREEALLQKLKPYREKKGFLAQRPVIAQETFEQEDTAASALAAQAEEAMAAEQTLASKEQSLQAAWEQIAPWRPLTLPASALHDTAFSRVFTGYVPPQAAEETTKTVAQAGGELVLLDSGRDGVAAYAVCAAEDGNAVESALKMSAFVASALPFTDGTASEALAALEAQQAALREQQAENKAQLVSFGVNAEKLELLADRRRAQEARESAPCVTTDMTVYWIGWVRGDRTDKLQKALDKALPQRYTLLLQEPAEDEEPPSVTQNNTLITPFETITDMFSRPNRHELDPNPVMSIWYWLIFGMMMGDVGYGLLMLVGLFAFKKLKKPRGEMAKLVDIMLYASLPTVFFGVMYGSYFGASWFPPVFVSPLDDPITMLAASLVVGVLHIFSGMAIKMAKDFRDGHPWDAIFDQLTWMIIITGCGLMLASVALPSMSILLTVGGGLAVFGAAVVLLTAGRKAKGFGKVTGGLLGLYNITGFLSDILSYSRILALALSGGVVGMVMNLLASMVQAAGPIGVVLSLLVYLVGHAFNIAMSLLSAYVHDSRLQYIEFFGKFYEGGGAPFKPLTRGTKYVDVEAGE